MFIDTNVTDLLKNKTLYGALTRWGNTNTHITVYDTRYSTHLFQLRSKSGPEEKSNTSSKA